MLLANSIQPPPLPLLLQCKNSKYYTYISRVDSTLKGLRPPLFLAVDD